MLLKLTLFLTLSHLLVAAPANSPGVEWKPEWIKIIRAKLDFLWDRSKLIKGKFNIESGAPEFNKYVYDPLKKTVTAPYEKCINKEKCDHIFADVDEKLQFSREKVLRLAFHDCVPYEGGGGGCDGCLNMDEDLKGNMGLQHTIATLEKLYLEADFPKHKRCPTLKKSPKDLGISRADLWAFAGVASLDKFMRHTRDICENVKTKTSTATCRWWDAPGADASECFEQFPESAMSMFKTGRTDCIASPAANEFQQYLASQKEDHPDENGNGQMTVDYYARTFGFTGKEGLILNGVHVIGQLNSIFSGNAYFWTRGARLFNNAYYKLLTGEPERVFESCVGTLDDKPAPGAFVAIANIHFDIWKEEPQWANATRAGHIRWDMSFKRGPDCGPEKSFGRMQDEDDYWGRRGLFPMCCADKMACFEDDSEGGCRDTCTFLNGDKRRFIGPDVGYYLDWQVVNGLPRGCEAFKNKNGDWMTEEEFRSAGQLKGPKVDGKFDVLKNGVGCQLQTMQDGEGGVMHETVEHLAKNNKEWIHSFAGVFAKMQANGYSEFDLNTQQLDTDFWTHMK